MKATLLAIIIVLLIIPSQVFANGCIVVRPTSQPSVGLDDRHESKAGSYDTTVAYRYLFSDRHFRGSHEEKNRQAEGTQIENTINTIDYTFSYWYTDQWRFSASIPYTTAKRTSARDRAANSAMRSEGIGDLRVMAYREFLSSTDETPSGMTLGIGLKLPTGRHDFRDISYRPSGPEWRYNDQSIQLGDGGTGLITEFQAYRQFFNEHNYGFVTASYLINPEDTNGTPTHRSNPFEQVQSIPDTYQARFGWTHVFSSGHWSFDSAIRGEGVPVEDLIGDSNGFRRPGYAIYFEPSLNFRKGAHRGALSIPYALERNRLVSVADRKTGGHGDAAFADYLIMASYSYSWQ